MKTVWTLAKMMFLIAVVANRGQLMNIIPWKILAIACLTLFALGLFSLTLISSGINRIEEENIAEFGSAHGKP